MILPLLMQFIVAHSLTISPVSFSYHNFDDKEVEAYYKRTIGKKTTVHPGLHLKYEHGFFQTSGWYFLDSFGRHAGGLIAGPKFDFWWLSLGIAGGGYVREHNVNTPLKFPLHTKMGPVAVGLVGGVTGSIKIPIGGSHAVELGCITAWKLTNCSAGLNFKF